MTTLVGSEYRTAIANIIKEEHGVAPGEPPYLGHYQTCLKKIVENLEDEERERFERMVEEWDGNVPDDVARR